METIRPIARGNRMLTPRGRELILRRRRQNERDARGAARWEGAKVDGVSADAYLDRFADRGPVYAPTRGLKFGR